MIDHLGERRTLLNEFVNIIDQCWGCLRLITRQQFQEKTTHLKLCQVDSLHK